MRDNRRRVTIQGPESSDPKLAGAAPPKPGGRWAVTAGVIDEEGPAGEEGTNAEDVKFIAGGASPAHLNRSNVS